MVDTLTGERHSLDELETDQNKEGAYPDFLEGESMIRHEALPWAEKKKVLTGIQKGEKPSFISTEIAGITRLKLTLAGQIRLLAYPTPAVVGALNYLTNISTSSICFSYTSLIKTLNEWCERNNVAPDFAWIEQLNTALKIPVDAPKTEILSSSVSDSNIKYIGTTKVRILSEEETNARRAALINNPDVVAGIDNLAKLIGDDDARQYFVRVLENLKYEAL